LAIASLAVSVLLLGGPPAVVAKGHGGHKKHSGGHKKHGHKKHSGSGHKPSHPAGPIGSSGKGASARLSRQPIPVSGAWRGYVLDSPSPDVYPVNVAIQSQTPPAVRIEDPAGLAAPGGGSTSFFSNGPSGPSEIVDLGRETGGRVQIAVGANSGVQIKLAYSEARRFLGPGGDVGHGSQGRSDDPSSRTDVLPSAPGIYTLGGIRGAERYVRIEVDGSGSASIDYIRVEINHLRPTADSYAGHFLSSDPLLNRIWYAGAYTLNVDTYGDPNRGNQFAVTDGAKHDRLVWLGDLPMESLAGFYTVRQLRPYLRRSLQMFTCQQEPGGFVPQVSEVNVDCPQPGPANGPPHSAKGICTCVVAQRLPSYTAWFVVGVGEYYRMTADPRVAKWLPVVERAIGYFQRGLGPRGLFVTRLGELNWHPPDLAEGEDGDTNAVWVRALQSASTLEQELGTPRLGHRYATMARRLSGAIRTALFDPAVGALHGNTFDPTGDHPQDANVQGVISGVLRGAAAGSALNFLAGPLATSFGTATGQFNNDPYMGRYISPFESGWELYARFQYFQTGQALNLIRRTWGQMVNNDPGDTLWEKMTTAGGVAPYQSFNPDGSPIVENAKSGETSLAHGWSAGPTAMLSAYVLGMRPVAPGWSTWLVQPQPGDLQYAQGTVSTPHGGLGVRWDRDPAGHSFRITVKTPGGADGTIEVPTLGRDRTIARDGRIVWKQGHAVGGAEAQRIAGYVKFVEPQRGTHTYAWVK
jgi:alpha-L-rhamnosidase